MASNDRHYANHYATIKKWLDEDSKGRSAKNYTFDDNEGECLRIRFLRKWLMPLKRLMLHLTITSIPLMG